MQTLRAHFAKIFTDAGLAGQVRVSGQTIRRVSQFGMRVLIVTAVGNTFYTRCLRHKPENMRDKRAVLRRTLLAMTQQMAGGTVKITRQN
jgi:hypothetical protein